MDVGDGIRMPLKDILKQDGIPIMIRNPLSYGEAGGERSHPAYVDLTNNKENSLQRPELCTLSQMLQTKPPKQGTEARRRRNTSSAAKRSLPRPPRV